MMLLHGDCLELLKEIPDKSVDMVLCDLPYGTTDNKWDVKIPLDRLWEQWKRVVTENAAICLFAQMPFAAELVYSNRAWYRYEWILRKQFATGFLNANRMPLRSHESVQVFYQKLPTYHPQMRAGEPYRARTTGATENYGNFKMQFTDNSGTRMPDGFIPWPANFQGRGLHPTGKPVSICEYLIRTYTDEGDTVLDNCMGGGSTGVACVRTGRDFIGIEKEQKYFDIAQKRIEEQKADIGLTMREILDAPDGKNEIQVRMDGF